MMDTIDKKILMTLQNNGKISNVALAKEIGLTPPATLERVRKLEETGYIEGYKAVLNYKKLDRGLSCMIAITLVRQGKRNMQPFDEQLKQLTEVEKFYHVTGRFDYIVKVNLKNVEELRDLLVNKLTDIDIIDRAETLIILSSETERGVQL